MSEWPAYQVADSSVVYALGVMNINYVRFETTHVLVLSAVANMKQNQAAVFVSRMNPNERANVIDIFLKRREWPNETSKAIAHYNVAMRAMTDSRNMLIHGNIVDMGGTKQPGILSLNRQGLTTIFQSSLSSIRKVADDLHIYSLFGYDLTAYIATEFHAIARESGMLALSECPACPPMPLKPK